MAKCFLISGEVQGVFFRASTRDVATSLGLNGYARNLPDGRVEVVAEGDVAAMQQLREWLQHGPELARVDEIIESDSPLPTVDGFRIR